MFDDASPSHPYRKSFKVDIYAIMMGAVANAELMPVLVQENKHSNLRRCRLRIRTRLTRNSGNSTIMPRSAMTRQRFARLLLLKITFRQRRR